MTTIDLVKSEFCAVKLQECLTQTPYRNLSVIARLLDIRRGHNAPKAELVKRLAATLRRPEVLQRAVEQLTSNERRALEALVAAGGKMSWPAFRERFGDIRPYRPWRDDAPRRPWRDPISPAEALWYRGLIYHSPRQPRPGHEAQVVIPEELLPSLPEPAETTITEHLRTPPEQQGSRRGNVGTDVAILISLLHRQDVEPLWDRWLPPQHFRDLAERFSVPEEIAEARSELQTGRLRFIHFLAETAGLVAPAGRWLKPTPQAWGWLDQAAPSRFERLWTAWRDGSDGSKGLWRRYRLPGGEVETVFEIVNVLLDHVSELPAEEWCAAGSFTQDLVNSEPVLSKLPPAWDQDEARQRGRKIIMDLIQEPLVWWGCVELTEEDDELLFSLTSLGQWLLTGDTGARPSSTETPMQVSHDLLVLVPEGVAPRDLIAVEGFAEWEGWADGRRCYQVTQGSVSRALSRSASLQDIIDTLSQQRGGDFGVEQVATLKTWADETKTVRLRQVTLLETRSAERLQALSGHRTIRRYFRGTLSPRAAVVAADRAENLVRALERQGVWPLNELPSSEEATDSPSDAAVHLWIAGHVYAELSQWIDLPKPLPRAVLDDLAAEMDATTSAAARQAVDDALEQLADAMDGWARYPMPGAGLPPRRDAAPHRKSD